MRPSIAVIGPTASGKSDFARHLASFLKPAVIINADAMQLYRQCRSLTSQPSQQMQRRVPHRLYAVLDMTEPASARRWGEMARRQITVARSRGAFPILVGGSGFYLRSLLYGLAAIPQPPPRLRLRARRAATGEAWQKLRKLDPVAAARIPKTDKQRLARALEVIDATGVRLSRWQNRLGKRLDGRTIVITLSPPRSSLERLVRRRLKKIAPRAAAEAKQASELSDSHELEEFPLGKACGFREFAAHASGLKTLSEATEETFLSTRRYIRRQLTWLRNQPPRPNLLVRRPHKAAAKRAADLILAGRI